MKCLEYGRTARPLDLVVRFTSNPESHRTMWPFKKKPAAQAKPLPPRQISFTQLDTTETFNGSATLGLNSWVATVPLNSMIEDPESMGLPSLNAGEDEIYQIASKFSRLRESIRAPSDGVYCAICHIANVDLTKLRMPCPKCGRELLSFGWD